MSRRDELTAWKGGPQVVDNLPLPLRVQMQVDFVNQDDRFGFRGRIIVKLGFACDKPSGQVQYDCQYPPFPIRQAAARELAWSPDQSRAAGDRHFLNRRFS